MATINFISTTEFRDINPGLDLSRYTETTLSGVLTRATAKVEEFLGYSLPYEAITDEKNEGIINSNNDLIIFPKKYPVRTFTACTIVKGTYSGTIDLTNARYDIPSRGDEIVIAGISLSFDTVSLVDFNSLKQTDFYVQYSYTAGYYMYDRPQAIVDAISLYARDEVSRSLNVGGASEIRQGGVTIKYSDSQGKSDFIQDAEALLVTYQRIAGF